MGLKKLESTLKLKYVKVGGVSILYTYNLKRFKSQKRELLVLFIKNAVGMIQEQRFECNLFSVCY